MDNRAKIEVILAHHCNDFLWLRCFCKTRKAPQISEYYGHLLPMTFENLLLTFFDYQLSNLRRQKALEPTNAFNLFLLIRHSLFKGFVPECKLSRLRSDFVMHFFYSQHRFNS